MNEDGTVNRKNVKRKGIEIVNSIAAGGGEGMDKLLQAAADSGSVSSTTLMGGDQGGAVDRGGRGACA